MATLTLRLPNDFDRQPSLLAAQTHQNRSEWARAALEKFLHEQARAHALALSEGRRPRAPDPAEAEAQWWK